MALYIDSANLNHIQDALETGWISGITTNPLLLAGCPQPAVELLTSLKQLSKGPIFYQLISQDLESLRAEAHLALEILETQLVLKLPPTRLGFRLCSEISGRIPCCPTAIYSPAQALLAGEAGARYLAVYVNRASRLMGDGIALVRDIAGILSGSGTEILAASLKSPEEAVAASLAGARHLTLPYPLLMEMIQQPLSQAAVEEFLDKGRGLSV